MSDKTIVVVGAGPGVSGSVARRFAREGYAAGLVGVDEGVLETLADELRGLGVEVESVVADITDVAAATAALAGLAERLGAGRRAPLQPERLPREGPAHPHRARAARGRRARRRRPAHRRTGRPATPARGRAGHGDRQHGRGQALEHGRVPRRTEGRSPQPGAQPRHHTGPGRHPCGVGDGAWLAGQGGAVHPRSGRRGDLRRGVPGRGRTGAPRCRTPADGPPRGRCRTSCRSRRGWW